jgi:co-chaperonin GroES (HSP10)
MADKTKLGRPFGNRVLVKRIEHEKKGTLILSGSQSSDGRFVKGIIVAVGDPIPNLAGIERDPGIKTGDVILYNPYNAVKISFPDNTEYYDSMSYNEILHIFDETVEIVDRADLIPKENRAGNFF